MVADMVAGRCHGPEGDKMVQLIDYIAPEAVKKDFACLTDVQAAHVWLTDAKRSAYVVLFLH